MKSILSVQDLSCAGRCSLTVALPVISAMGHRCSVLPTAVLSTHTGFPSPYVIDMTGQITAIADHWKEQGIRFDAASVGYLSRPAQAEAVIAALEGLTDTVVLDPAMGDGGRLYSRMTPAHVEAMKRLCRRATVLLPNVTEAALLTDTPYEVAMAEPEGLLEKLMEFGPEAVVITGVTEGEQVGFVGTENGRFRYLVPRIPKQLHGTGDLFTAVFTGAYASGKTCEEAATQAAGFVEQVVANTKAVTPFGPDFEPLLGLLRK